MRRLLSWVVCRVKDEAKALAESWDGFWFTPADPTLLAVLRILTGLMLLYTHAVWGLALREFFGPSAWLSRSFVRAAQETSYTYSFWWVVPEGWIWPAYALSMLVLALFTLGVWTRVTSVLALAVTISYAHRAPEAMFGLDQINAMLTLYLAVGPSGRALSVDRWRAVRNGEGGPTPLPSARANLAQRLIQVHMCVIYFFAGISKLQGESWWSGDAMWRAFANYEYQSLDMTWLAWHPWLLNLATHVSVAWEIFFCTLVWRPRLRPLMLALGVALHVGIGACLGMWTFGLIMLVGCASFLPNEGVRQIVEALTRRRRGNRSLVLPFPLMPEGDLRRPSRAEEREPVLVGEEV